MSMQSLVESKLIPQGTSGNDILYGCPECEDPETGHHLYVDYDKGYFHCFKCGFGGKRIESLLRKLNVSLNIDYEKLYSEQEESLDDILSMKSTKEVSADAVDYSTDLDVLTQYYLQQVKPLSGEGYQYLLNRGLDYETICRLGICEGVNRFGDMIRVGNKEFIGRDYSNRIMIPSLRKDGKISFYLGRDTTGTKDNKYVNPSKELVAASEDVWSLDIIDTRSIVICEGVFSAIAVNNALGKLTACATYGKSIANKSSETSVKVTSQGEKLLAKGYDTYIMFYDKDALSEAYKNALYLYERGAKVKIVKIPENMYGDHADAGDMTKQEIIRLIVNSEDFDPFSASISGLM